MITILKQFEFVFCKFSSFPANLDLIYTSNSVPYLFTLCFHFLLLFSRFCHRRGWSRSSLILAMPQGTRHKDQVTMVSYSSTNYRDSYILAWVNHQLATKLQSIPDIHDAVDYWLDTTPTDNKYPDKHPVKVSLFSEEANIPLFYSAVSMKFSGRIKFGYMNMRGKSDAKRLGLEKLPSYMITTPEGLMHYGYEKGQYLKYNVLDLYLRTLYPEANDLLLLCFTVVNSVCVLELFLTPGGAAKRICCFLWVVGKYNLGLLIVWLPVLGLFQFSLMNPVWRLGLKLARLLSQTGFISQLRNDWIVYSTYSNWLIGSYLAYCLLVGWLKLWRQGPIPESDISSGAWVRETMHQFYNFLLRPSPQFYRQPLSNPILEDGLDVWIERMATPDLWLHDIVPTDYIKDLPTWKYNGVQWNDLGEHLREENVVQKQPQREEHPIGSNLFMQSDGKMGKVSFSPICAWCKGATAPGNEISKESTHSKISDVKKTFSGNINIGCNVKPKQSKIKRTIECDQSSSCFNPLKSGATKMSQVGPSNFASNKKFSPRNDDISIDSNRPTQENTDMPNRIEDIPICKCAQTTKGDMSKVRCHSIGDPWPDIMLECTQCAICLDPYNPGVILCGLPCGHSYHHQCILVWLKSGKHECPHCRWPAFKSKKAKLSKHME